MLQEELNQVQVLYTALKDHEKKLDIEVEAAIKARFNSIDQLMELANALPRHYTGARRIFERIEQLRTAEINFTYGKIGEGVTADIEITLSSKAGKGKSTLAALIAKALGSDFKVVVDDRDGDFGATLKDLKQRKDVITGSTVAIREYSENLYEPDSGPGWQTGMVLMLDTQQMDQSAGSCARQLHHAAVVMQVTPTGTEILKNRWGKRGEVIAPGSRLYILAAWGNAAPEILGPFQNDAARLAKAAAHLKRESGNVMFRLDINDGVPNTAAFTDAELDIDPYDNKLLHHPEQRRDEIYLGNYPVHAYRIKLGWKQLRAGVGGNSVPVFLKRQEVEEHIANLGAGSASAKLLQKMLDTGTSVETDD